MTRSAQSKRSKADSPASSERDYDVGYAKPPQTSRFQPGRSGNPKGRPKGSRNRNTMPALHEEKLKSIILQEAYRTVAVNDGNRSVSIPMAQAVVRSLAVNAAKGNQRAQRLFTQILAATETANKRLHDEWLETAITYKVEWDSELARRQRLGIVAPAPLPHPDDIVIDMNTGTVRIKGPMTKEQQQTWEELRQRKREHQNEIKELQAMLREDPDCSYRSFVEDDIEHSTKLVAMIGRVIPD